MTTQRRGTRTRQTQGERERQQEQREREVQMTQCQCGCQCGRQGSTSRVTGETWCTECYVQHRSS